jgi:succinyl-diaminopimelate desuccinylase
MYEELFRDILEAVEIYSPTNDRTACSKALEWFFTKAKEFGFEAEYRADGEVLVVGNNNEISADIGVICHVDVVPVNPDEWHYSPYGEKANGRLYGRGVLDDKGPTVMALHVMREISKKQPDKTWQIIIASREEEIWTDVEKYISEGWPLPKVSFTPDGDWPITNREKGYCDVTFNFPRPDKLIGIQAGEANNSVPSKAFAIWDDEEITVQGKIAHSSVPWVGDNAIVKLLSQLDIPKLSDFGRRFQNTFDGADSLSLEHHPRFVNGEDMEYTTAVPTMCYQDNEGIHINVNLRTVYGTTREEIERGFNKVASEIGCTYTIQEYLDPIYVPANDPSIVKMQDSYENITGERPVPALCRGTSYGKSFPNTVVFGPRFTTEEDTCHCPDENQSEEDIEKDMQIYLCTMEKILEVRDKKVERSHETENDREQLEKSYNEVLKILQDISDKVHYNFDDYKLQIPVKELEIRLINMLKPGMTKEDILMAVKEICDTYFRQKDKKIGNGIER